jgi:hypothetical protein
MRNTQRFQAKALAIRCRQCRQLGHAIKNCPLRLEVNQSLSGKQQTRLVSNLKAEDDSPGLISFRRGDDPSEFDLGKGFDLLQGNSELHDIANSTGTFIVPKQIGKSGWIARIWGKHEDLKQAKTRLGELVFQLSEKREKSFAKYQSYSYRDTMSQLDQENQHLLRLEYLKMPSIETLILMTFAGMDAIEWKLEQPPKEVLGANLGLLDQIRMDCQVYIYAQQTNSNKSWYLLCYGQNMKSLGSAVRRLIKVQENAAAAEPPSVEFYLVKPVKFSEVKKDIALLDYKAPCIIERSGQIVPAEPCKLGLFVFGSDSMDEEDWDIWDQSQRTDISDLEPGEINIVDYSSNLNAQYLELWFGSAMQNMPNYNGSLKMKVTIGTCTFHSFPGKAYGNFHISFFRQLLKDRNADMNQLGSKFADELGHRDIEDNLYQQFFSNHQHLQLMHHHDFSNIYERNPKCTISFKLLDPNHDNSKENIQLRIEFPGPTSPGNIKWSRVPKQGHTVLNVNILDFQNVNFSYNLVVQRTLELKDKEVGSLPTVYRQFAKGVSLNSDFVETFLNDKNSTARMYDQDSRYKVPIVAIEQRRTWSFQVQNTDYIVDLHLFMNIKVQPLDNMRVNHIKSENRWAVEVRHKSWDEKFAQNQDLRIGMGARWKAEESEFFPAPQSQDGIGQGPGGIWERGSGFRELLRVLDKVVEIMSASAVSSEDEDCKEGQPYEDDLIEGVECL